MARRPRTITLVLAGGVAVGLAAAIVALAAGGGASGPATTVAQTGPPPPAVTITWVGDSTLGSAAGDPPDAGRALFGGVRSLLRKADFAFANLEGTLARGVAQDAKCGEDSGGTCFSFAAPPSYAGAIAWAGIDIVNIANNHADDYGPSGEYATIQALFAQGVAHTGLPNEITILQRRGTRVAFIGFAPYPWAARLDMIPQAQALIRKATTEADVVVVAMHAGAEGRNQTHTPVGVEEAYGENRGDTRGFAHAAIDAGADLVVGSGPHVLRGIEDYHGKLIAYSLGNFAGWKNFAQGGVLSLSGALRVKLSGRGALLSARFTPLVLTDPGVPQRDSGGPSTALVNRVSQADFPGTAVTIGRGGAIRPAGARAAG